jgi:hypothetical protein
VLTVWSARHSVPPPLRMANPAEWALPKDVLGTINLSALIVPRLPTESNLFCTLWPASLYHADVVRILLRHYSAFIYAARARARLRLAAENAAVSGQVFLMRLDLDMSPGTDDGSKDTDD